MTLQKRNRMQTAVVRMGSSEQARGEAPRTPGGPIFKLPKTGVIILIVSRGFQSQKMGLFPFNPSLR